jgi:DNA (cytosine-5)-methyltransferase 1
MTGFSDRRVVDLYAGPGGWDEGMQSLGIADVVGIEHDWAACKTATAAGHRRVQADVLTVPPGRFAGYWGLVASPPCQAWSMAGKRLGEADRRRVHELVDRYAAGADDPGTGWADDRSHHTAQPVRWIREVRPRWACLEQVRGVLPLWEHVGRVLERWGYWVWTGVLNTANYGVPQTRERAVLIATTLGVATSPPPTHDAAPGLDLFGAELLPWITMRQALGWHGQVDRRTNSKSVGGVLAPTVPVTTDRPAPTLTRKAAGQWVLSEVDPADQPARTVCGNRAPRWAYGVGNSYATGRTVGRTISIVEAAVLQGFRADYPWFGNKSQASEQVGNAVPPPLAAAVVGAAISVSAEAVSW